MGACLDCFGSTGDTTTTQERHEADDETTPLLNQHDLAVTVKSQIHHAEGIIYIE